MFESLDIVAFVDPFIIVIFEVEFEDELLFIEELLDDELPPLLANHEFSFTPFTLKLSLC